MAVTLALAMTDPVFAILLQTGWLASAQEWLREPERLAWPMGRRVLAAAQLAMAQGDWMMAIDLLRRLSESEAPSAFQTVVRAWLGRAWHGLGRLDMAEEVVKSCLGLPGSDEAVLELAVLQEARGSRLAAIRTLTRERRRLIERHPPLPLDPAIRIVEPVGPYERSFLRYSCQLADWWLAEGDVTSALDCWAEARAQVTADAESYRLEAGLLARAGLMPQAYRALALFVRLYVAQWPPDPTITLPDAADRAYADPALTALLQSPSHQEAAAFLLGQQWQIVAGDPTWREHLVTAYPEHPVALFDLGVVWLAGGQVRRALPLLERMAALPCANPHVRQQGLAALRLVYAQVPERQEQALAMCETEAPDSHLAASLFQSLAKEGRWPEFDSLARRLAPEQRGALPALVEALLLREDEAAIVFLLEHLAAAVPGEPHVLSELITRQLLRGDVEGMAANTRALVRTNPGFSTFESLARRFWHVGQRAMAESFLLQFSQTFPSSNEPLWTLAAWWSESEDPADLEQANEHARQAQRRKGPLAPNHRVIARLAAYRQEYLSALKHYRSALQAAPEDLALVQEVAAFAIRQGYVQEAEMAVERLKQISGTFSPAIVPLADQLWQAGQRQRAMALYLEAEAHDAIDTAGKQRIIQWLIAKQAWDPAVERLSARLADSEAGSERTLIQVVMAKLLAQQESTLPQAMATLEGAVEDCQWLRLTLPGDTSWDMLRNHPQYGLQFEHLLA
ncbi:MAG: hypothetical protein H7338_09180 [Candidatus Sericytochromatia bacterium]|nr:hypothetical protein [Candidatus Sericytochromatia bacterium]